jgi:hypothetical protein
MVDWLRDVLAAPFEGLYVLGGLINEIGGGDTKEWWIGNALRSNENVVANLPKALSAYDPATNGFQLPVLNRYTVDFVVDDLVSPVTDKLWDKLKVPLLVAGGVAAAVLVGRSK